jgi:hypothetical protein
MQQIQIDFVTVLIAAVLNMVVGSLWYSKWLFGHHWMKLSGFKETELKHPGMAMFWGFIVSLVIAYFLAFFESLIGVTTVSDGMFVGFTLWLGFVMTTQLNGVIWGKMPGKLFLLHTTEKLIALLVMSGVIGA